MAPYSVEARGLNLTALFIYHIIWVLFGASWKIFLHRIFIWQLVWGILGASALLVSRFPRALGRARTWFRIASGKLREHLLSFLPLPLLVGGFGCPLPLLRLVRGSTFVVHPYSGDPCPGDLLGGNPGSPVVPW